MGWKPTPEQMEIMNEDAYLVDSGILDRAIQDAKQVWYGIVRWHYLPLMKSSTLFDAAYDSIEDIVAEVAERIGEFSPDDFNCKDNIRNIVGTYYG